MKNENELEFVECFFHDSALKVPEKFYRIHNGGSRFYVDSEFSLRIGITSFLSKILPENYYLALWKKEQGEANAAQILKDRARYGTMFHVLAARVLRNYKVMGSYDIPLTSTDLKDALALEFINTDDIKHYEYQELQTDLAAFAAFCEAYNPEPILLEAPLGSKKTKLAATLDFFGWITVEKKGFWGEIYVSGAKKGTPKETKKSIRILSVIDFKTMIKKDNNQEMNKAIGVSNKFQLNYQLMFLKENYPEYAGKEIKMFNAVPKNWRTEPAMQLTEVEHISDYALLGLYEASKYINPYIVEKTEEKQVKVFGEYTGNIKDSFSMIQFKEHCRNLIESETI